VPALLRIGELSRRSGVPIATLKHYLREGLIAPTKKSGRTMSWYDPALATRVQAIKELQQRQFLPLDVIREALDRDAAAPDEVAAADAIAKVLERHTGSPRAVSRAEVLERGMASARELDILAAMGLARAGDDGSFRGDDLALLSTLGAARRAGITAEMLPFSIVDNYLRALRALVAAELQLFRDGVIPRAAPGKLEHLTTTATELSERLVVLIRRKLLLPTLTSLMEEDRERPNPAGSRSGRVQRTRKLSRRSPRRGRSHKR
jgi:DNA-binding transcriptional MerR regulator